MSTASTPGANHSDQDSDQPAQASFVRVPAIDDPARPADPPRRRVPSFVVGYAISENIAERNCSNCACAETTGVAASWRAAFDKDTQTGNPGSAFVRQTRSRRFALTEQYVAAFSSFSPGQVVLLSEAAERLLEYFAEPHFLHEAALFEPGRPSEAIQAAQAMAEAGLLQAIDFSPPVPDAQRTLTAWLHLTDACNLRCSYCFVTHSSTQMDERTGRAAVAAVFCSASRPGCTSVKLKYAGGEPTLCFDLLRSLHQYARGGRPDRHCAP